MHSLASILHDPLIKGEKIPKLQKISELLSQHKGSGEVQLCYDLLSTLAKLTLKSP